MTQSTLLLGMHNFLSSNNLQNGMLKHKYSQQNICSSCQN